MMPKIHGWILLVASALLLSACTAVEDAGTDVSRKFDEGITGQGRLVSPNATGDEFGSDYQ
jgi:predicted small secreted protein